MWHSFAGRNYMMSEWWLEFIMRICRDGAVNAALRKDPNEVWIMELITATFYKSMHNMVQIFIIYSCDVKTPFVKSSGTNGILTLGHRCTWAVTCYDFECGYGKEADHSCMIVEVDSQSPITRWINQSNIFVGENSTKSMDRKIGCFYCLMFVRAYSFGSHDEP